MTGIAVVILEAVAKMAEKAGRLKLARKILDSVGKKKGAVALVAVALFAAPGCAIWKNVDDCSKLRLAEQLACPVDPASTECVEARARLAAVCGVVTPVPTPVPVPTPIPDPIPTPTPTPVPTPVPGCVLSGEPTTNVTSPNNFGALVNMAMHALRPDCEIGGTCVLGNVTQQTWQAAVEAELRRLGYCAGQHSPSTDEIAVAARPNDLWLGYRVMSGDDSEGPVPTGGVRRTVQWSPQAFRGAWLPPTGTPPPPSVTDYGCPIPRPDRVWTPETLPPGWGEDQIGQPRWKLVSEPHGPWIDTTAKTNRNLPYCEATKQSPDGNGNPVAGCPMRAEGGVFAERVACERYVAEGDWVVVAANGATCEQNPDNSAQFRRTSDAGTCRLCNPALTVCSAAY